MERAELNTVLGNHNIRKQAEKLLKRPVKGPNDAFNHRVGRSLLNAVNQNRND